MTKAILLVCAAMLSIPSGTGVSRQPPVENGIYVTVDPVLGKAMVGSPLFDAAFVSTGRVMKQHIGASRVAEVFERKTADIGLVVESHGGEVVVSVRVVRNGREEYATAAQGPHVICHYSDANGKAYISPFK